MPYQDLDSPDDLVAGAGNTPTSSDDEITIANLSWIAPDVKNLSSSLSPVPVSRSRVIGSSEGLNPVRGETPSQFLQRQRAATGDQNLQLSNEDIERQFNGNELVWDGNNFVDQTSATLDPRGRDQIPPVTTVEAQDQPTENSVTQASNIGYAAGQIDPGLARAAGIKPQSAQIGYGVGQVDPALAKAAGLVASPGVNSGATGTQVGSVASGAAGGAGGAVGGGTGSGTPPAGTAAPTSFNDRYDFLTKQKVREGKHGGQGGGAGTTMPCESGGSMGGTTGGSFSNGAGSGAGGTAFNGDTGINTGLPAQSALINGQVAQVGYGPGQVDPALARAAGGTSVGFGAGQVDPALARAVQNQNTTTAPTNPKPLPQPTSGNTGPF